MSKDLNQCSFIGRLGKPIELKYTAGGSAVANFSIACGDDYKDKNGQKVEQTNWINCVSFGKSAEILAQYTDKGSQLFVQGKQTTRKWQDQSVADRYTTEINVNNFQFLSSNSDSNQGRTRQQQKPVVPKTQTNQSDAQPVDDGFDDIPF